MKAILHGATTISTDWISGTLSGGADGCRKITEIEADTDTATIYWHYPETCGLSDCRYHYTDPITCHEDKFTLRDDDTLIVDGTVFDMDDDIPFKDLVMPMVYKFLVKWGIKAIKPAEK